MCLCTRVFSPNRASLPPRLRLRLAAVIQLPAGMEPGPVGARAPRQLLVVCCIDGIQDCVGQNSAGLAVREKPGMRPPYSIVVEQAGRRGVPPLYYRRQ